MEMLSEKILEAADAGLRESGEHLSAKDPIVEELRRRRLQNIHAMV